jgi:hypothetical protein
MSVVVLIGFAGFVANLEDMGEKRGFAEAPSAGS